MIGAVNMINMIIIIFTMVITILLTI